MGGGAHGAGQEAAAQRGERHEPDVQLPQDGQDAFLDPSGEQGVLGLDRGDRLDGVGSADRVGSGLRESESADLALGDQLADGARCLLDRRVRVDPVLVVQVDVVGAQPLQRALDRGTDVGRAGVEVPGAVAGVGDQAELGGQNHLVPAPLQCPPEQLSLV
ncbi:hypothetical protein GCM10017674_53840 [Streptomyces gardneri]|uniref:Uncharacterized protein n=1 Tax=Streptomyces gardneri TaxID=66892 RepID=A0A4Y3RHR6_9ACTN|nr:hypothetical protein SGA01_09850 [Streptomyces gardneri]GHH09941.1 hypothetical protein GCM10017674_53840 [Streptomyces gardneri]